MAYMLLELNDLHYPIVIFNSRPTRNATYFKSMLLEQNCCNHRFAIAFDSVLSLFNSTNVFSRLLCLFSLVVVILKNVSNYLILYLLFRVLQHKTVFAAHKLINSLFKSVGGDPKWYILRPENIMYIVRYSSL